MSTAPMPKIKHFTVDEYYRMKEGGILSDNRRFELIEGEIVEMTPIGSKHAGLVDKIANLLNSRSNKDFIVRVQNPVRLNQYSELQPDITLLKPEDDFYTSEHPGPDDVLLLIEVADTSLDYDRDRKIPAYAEAGVPIVWLVNLEEGIVEVHHESDPEGYQFIETYRGTAELSFESLGLELSTDDLFVERSQ